MTVDDILVLYVAVVVTVAAMSPLWLFDGDRPPFIAKLRHEGIVVLCIFVALLWPLGVLVGVAWALRAFGRGVAQIVALLPQKAAKPALPRAKAMRSGERGER